MLFTVLFTLIATATATFANVLGSSKQSSKACSRELEGIIYTPANCGFSYLKSISKQLTSQAPLLFQPSQIGPVVSSFASTYNVLVILNDAIGNIAYATSDNPLITAPHMTSSIARAMALGEGYASASYTNFAAQITYAYITYSYILWNTDGQYYNVNLYLPKANAPTFC